jgi:hypothetical protein
VLGELAGEDEANGRLHSARRERHCAALDGERGGLQSDALVHADEERGEETERGAADTDAAREAVSRIASTYPLESHHQAAFLVMARDGSFASASLRPGYRTSVRDASGARAVEPDFVAIPDASVTEPTA